MRVLANGPGSEVIFRSDEKYAGDVRLVERDLRTLKTILEA
jgi:hypothetical protein